jgi:hypothetical protein
MLEKEILHVYLVVTISGLNDRLCRFEHAFHKLMHRLVLPAHWRRFAIVFPPFLAMIWNPIIRNQYHIHTLRTDAP